MSGRGPEATALSWCLREIRESLDRAGKTLTELAPVVDHDPVLLRAARGWVHQAQGALQVVDLGGVALILQEAEAFIDAALRKESPVTPEAVAVLTGVFSATLEYLEARVGGATDSPVALFPSYRDVLQLRRAERIEPSDLFEVDLSPRPPRPAAVTPLSVEQLAGLKVDFERGLLAVLRDARGRTAIGQLQEVANRLHEAFGGSASRTFWWLVCAFLDGLKAGALDLDAYAKRLLGRVNRQVGQVVAEHAAVPDRMLRDLLFMLARARAGSPAVDEAKRLWDLAGRVPEDFETPHYAVVDTAMLEAAREATAVAKSAWEQRVRERLEGNAALEAALRGLDAALNRLPWPGLRKVSAVLLGVPASIEAFGADRLDVLALEVATGLLYVEQTLEKGVRAASQFDRRAVELAERLDRLVARRDRYVSEPPDWLTELTRSAQERLTVEAYIGEVQANLQRCERLLDAYFRAPQSAREGLAELGPALRQVAGALRLLGHEEAAVGTETVLRQADAFAQTDSPDAQACERVATSLGAIGFFATSLREGNLALGGFEFHLDGEGFLARLGDPVPGRAQGHPDLPVVEPPSMNPEVAASPVVQAVELVLPAMEGALGLEQELLEIFIGEARTVLAQIDAAHRRLRAHPTDPVSLGTVRRGFHTLKGASRMVGLDPFGEGAWAVEQVLNIWLSDLRPVTPALHALIDSAQAQMQHWIESMQSRSGASIDPAALIAEAQAFTMPEREPESIEIVLDGASLPSFELETITPADDFLLEFEPSDFKLDQEPTNLVLDPPPEEPPSAFEPLEIQLADASPGSQLHPIFTGEARQILGVLRSALDAWRVTPDAQVPEALARAIHSLIGTARLIGLTAVQQAAALLEDGLLALATHHRAPDASGRAELEWMAGRLQAVLDLIEAGAEPEYDAELIRRAREFSVHAESLLPVAKAVIDHPLETLAALQDEIDSERLGDFIEEADELLPRIGDALRAWSRQPAHTAFPESLMRLLHTVKGAARMVGAMRIGHLVHDMEARVERVSLQDSIPSALIDDLIVRHDQVLALYDAIRDPRSEAALNAAQRVVESLSGRVESPISEPESERVSESRPEIESRRELQARTEPEFDVEAEARELTLTPEVSAAEPGPADALNPPTPSLIRVRAELLDRLVNGAGEVSIARARLENELAVLRQSLGELTENVSRLRMQLREIQLAADSQIDVGGARNPERNPEFDPLEFDRYTRFQELTRMLAESVEDVSTVQHNALRSLDEAARDLTRQNQVTRDLQQDVMRIRMVQFGSVADRLYRVVRQSARELDRRVHFDLRGAETELDRSVLERMAGPIEHLLRNAVAHGVEPRAERTAAGKPDTGEIVLEVRQEASEVILRIADDGAGLNFERIRKLAIERKLIAPEARLSEHDLGDLIFLPGFTTATEVTEIAGRGIGMDVVRAEVAAMGGRIDIESVRGQGTRFTVHLPVSLAVTQVVLLTAGSMRIAVTSALVEQVMQLKPDALDAAYDRQAIEWHGQTVPLYYLGNLLDLPDTTPTAGRQATIVVVRSGANRIAVHVDHIASSQEVVVKHVGPQLARLTGMAGATVLADGSIVLILNPVQIASAGRSNAAGHTPIHGFRPARIEVAPTIMVVDDSVTVRKVTQRMLTREGYQVMLAKDGVDALRQLEEGQPDVMLLDVEMPRMDGFELTKTLRASERWKSLPIVMISSRTADKHHDHARSLGVDAFFGKPYDEAQLLALIARFVQERRARV